MALSPDAVPPTGRAKTTEMSPSLSGWKLDLILLLLLLAFATIMEIPVLFEPWGGDQGGYGYVAWGILKGKVPYKDMYSLTGYGIFFTYALLFKIFGLKMVSVHIGHLFVSLITLTLVFFLTKRIYGRKAAVIAALSYAIFSSGRAFSGFGYENKSAWGTYWYLAQREVFMAPLLMGAFFIAIFSRGRREAFPYLIAGALVGCAAFLKQTAVLALFALIAFSAVDRFPERKPCNFKQFLIRSLSMIAGFVAFQLPFICYFWAHGALKEVYNALFIHLSSYAKLSRGHLLETLLSGHYSVLSENLILWLFAAVSCLYILYNDRNRENLLVVLWAVCSLAMVWIQGKFFGYHFILLMPPFAVLTGYMMPKLLKSSASLKGFLLENLKDMRKAFVMVAIAGSLLSFFISNYDYYRWHALYLTGRISREEYYNVFNEFPTHIYSFRSDYQVARYLKEKADPGDALRTVFEGGDTVIHFLTGLRSPTRFIQTWYLFNREIFNGPVTRRLRREFISGIVEGKPRFILFVYYPFEELVNLPYLRDDADIRRLYKFIKDNYIPEKVFPDNRFLFRRVGGPLSQGAGG